MAIPYLDFLGETSPEEEARIRAEQQAAASTPESRAAQTRASNVNAGVSQYDPTLSARSVFGNPIATGQLASRATADQQAASRAMRQRTGGIGGDLARLGTAGVRTVYGTGLDTAADALGFGEVPRAIANPAEYLVRAGLDEGADQVIPGGSGARGSNLVPGQRGTGGDLNRPSETFGAADIFGAPIGASGGTTGTQGSGATPAPSPDAGSSITRPDSYRSEGGIEKPDAYRTDDVMSQLKQLFAGDQRQGPSEAEALLQQATDRAAAQALGIAAGARGGAGARGRARSQALSANAAMGSKASSDIGALRAREDAESRQRQAQIMGLLSGAAQGADTRDLGYAQADQAARAGADNLDLGYANAAASDRQSTASLANSAYQSEAQRELTRAMYNGQQPTGFLDDPLSMLTERFFGRPLHTRRV